jgi:type IV pilus assembly protein PilN
MIRINLLPVKAAKRRELGQRQLLVGVAAVTAVLVVLIVFHGAEAASVQKKRTAVADLQSTLERLKREVGDYDAVKKQRDELLQQREAIRKLEANRAGPVWVMRELSDVLTRGKGPTLDREAYEEQVRRDPNAGLNPSWDPKRVWVLTYEEKQHQVRMKCAAKSGEDVAQFTKRLKASPFFSSVYWKETQPQVDNKLNVTYVTFEVTCQVNY